ncbi:MULTISPECIES: Ig-like domain-containing protein [Niastella]|uniref:Secretion system C-terminal sorting domain-containing protein n=1 Tax=Niastella soli TaxID=2821487 RepID=A0ABS3Z449_9BACT|nr:Ig-like domain-containing protein [Niastella soli]MBO9204945.1 hypothetical protein [Niastella soli]
MKHIFTLMVTGILCHVSNCSFAQFSDSFESSLSSLSGNCWQFVNMDHSSDGTVSPIAGSGSLYSQPPVSGSSTRDISTPYLNITTSLQVSFKYKLSTVLHGNATRTIEIGLIDTSGNFTSLNTISMDKNSPATTQTYNNTFTLASASTRRLVFRLGGSTGDGNSRLIFDDLYTNANAYYGPTNNCNSAPIAINDSYNGITGNQVSGNVMTNDNDPNGEFIQPSIVTNSIDGTVVFNPDRSFTFIPNPGFTGSSTTFTYQLRDAGFAPMTSNIATVTINFTVGILLPVKLLSLQGNVTNNRISLKWVVDENTNAQRFEVEKSFNGNDYSLAGVLQATNIPGKESYSFDDNNGSNAKVMYRIKLVGNTNSEYSRVLVFKHDDNDSKLKIISNPVVDKLLISYNSEFNKSICIKIFDISGRLHMNLKMNVYTGNNVINVPLVGTIKRGLFIVDINDGSHISNNAKFITE